MNFDVTFLTYNTLRAVKNHHRTCVPRMHPSHEKEFERHMASLAKRTALIGACLSHKPQTSAMACEEKYEAQSVTVGSHSTLNVSELRVVQYKLY